MQEFETVIIGAGPAGLIAGQYLKDALVLDKKTEIGKPVQCGEGISKKALEMQGIKPHPDWVCCEIHKIERIMPNGKAIGKWHQKPIGYVINRKKFEKHLIQTAKAEIKLDTETVDLQRKNNVWEVTTKNAGVFRAKYVIGADGPSSIVRRKVFSENQQRIEFVPAIEYLVELEKEVDTKTLKIFLNNEKYKYGYAWVFPKSEKTANIGLCGKENLSEKFEWFVKEKVEKEYDNYRILENKSGTIPIRKENSISCKDNAMLVGDAAGLADPIFRGGMSQAMLSGKIAAECILKNKPEQYSRIIEKLPFAKEEVFQAAQKFYSFSSQLLNELGSVLNNRGFSDIRNPLVFAKLLKQKEFRKNLLNILSFFKTWQKAKNWLW